MAVIPTTTSPSPGRAHVRPSESYRRSSGNSHSSIFVAAPAEKDEIGLRRLREYHAHGVGARSTDRCCSRWPLYASMRRTSSLISGVSPRLRASRRKASKVPSTASSTRRASFVSRASIVSSSWRVIVPPRGARRSRYLWVAAGIIPFRFPLESQDPQEGEEEGGLDSLDDDPDRFYGLTVSGRRVGEDQGKCVEHQEGVEERLAKKHERRECEVPCPDCKEQRAG